jgi:hypothetical protein
MSGDPKHKWTVCPRKVRPALRPDGTWDRRSPHGPRSPRRLVGKQRRQRVNGKGTLRPLRRDAAHVQRRSVRTSNSSFFRGEPPIHRREGLLDRRPKHGGPNAHISWPPPVSPRVRVPSLAITVPLPETEMSIPIYVSPKHI